MSKSVEFIFKTKMKDVWKSAQTKAVNVAKTTALRNCVCSKWPEFHILIYGKKSVMSTRFIKFLVKNNYGVNRLNSEMTHTLEFKDIMLGENSHGNITCRRVQHECLRIFKAKLVTSYSINADILPQIPEW